MVGWWGMVETDVMGNARLLLFVTGRNRNGGMFGLKCSPRSQSNAMFTNATNLGASYYNNNHGGVSTGNGTVRGCCSVVQR